MYYQVKSGSDNLHAVGTGIGLAVSKQLINMMDGDIDIYSEEGFSSTAFTVSIRVPVNHVSGSGEQQKQSNLKIFMVKEC